MKTIKFNEYPFADFRTIAENIPDNVVRWDKEGRYLYINPAHERTLEASLDEVLGKTLSEVIPGGHPEVERGMKEVLEDGKESAYVIQKVIKKDGSEEMHEVKIVPEYNKKGEIVSILALGRDVTEVHRLQEELATSFRRFDALINNQGDFIARFDTECRHLFVNRSVMEAFGEPLEFFVGKTICDIEDSTSSKRLLGGVKEAIRTGMRNKLEVILPYKGDVRTFEVQHIPEFSSEGKVISVLAIGHDISGRKLYEKTLTQERQKLKTLTDNVSDTLARYDSRRRIVYANKKFEHMLGVKLSDIIGKTPTQLGLPEAEFFEAKVYEAFQKNRRIEFEHEITMQSGKKISGLVSITPEFNNEGSAEYVQVLTRDMSAYKKVVAELRARELEYRTLAENIPDNILRWDREGRYIYVSIARDPEIRKALKEVMVGKTISEAYPEGQYARLEQALFEVIATQKEIQITKLKVPLENDDYQMHDIYLVPEFDEAGEFVGVLGIGRDMTEAHRLQEALVTREEEYRTISENSLDTIIRYDLEHRRIYVNAMGEKLFGKPASEILGKTPSEFSPVPQSIEFEKLLDTVASTKKEIALETPFITSDGENGWGYMHLIPEFDSSGALKSILAVGREITKLKMYRDELARKEQEFRSLADNIPDNVVRWDKKGRYVYFNRVHEGTLETTLENALGKTISEIIPGGHPAVEGAIGQIAASPKDAILVKQKVVKQSGAVEIHDVKLIPEFDEAGEFSSILCLGRDMTEVYRLQEQVAAREKEYRTITENSSDIIIRYDLDLRRIYVNPICEKLFGKPASEILGRTPSESTPLSQGGVYESKIKDAIKTREQQSLEIPYATPDGEVRWGYMRFTPECDERGEIVSVLAVGRDISELKEYEKRLKEAQRIAKVGSWEFNIVSNALVWSDEIFNIFELEPHQKATSYEAFLNLVHPEDRAAVDEIFSVSLKNKTPYDVVHRVLTCDGRTKYVHERGETKYDSEGNPILTMGTVQDITEQKLAQAQIEFMAHHDILTGLPNRAVTKERTEHAIFRAKRNDTKVALLFIDLDGFKAINDALGHSTGDKILKLVADRLRECIKASDTVGRQSGDEFLAILSDIDDVNDTLCVTDKILRSFERPFYADSHLLSLSASIGISLYPDNCDNFEGLLQRADTAMYRAKEEGRNIYKFYTEDMNENIAEQLKIKNELKDAIANGEFVLYYQPQIDASSQDISGIEALIRWNHPNLGLLPPASFISVAESSGYILPIGDWVLQEACRQCAEWHEKGHKLSIAVNISAVQFRRNNLVNVVKKALEGSGLEPSFLELELTESILISDTENVLQAVKNLKELGVKLSIDDFGTGYSSLAYLKRFAVDKLKIDRSFVMDILRDQEDAVIVKTIIQMAKSLNLKTIAEGVEDREIFEVLTKCGCDEMQGFYFAKPMSAEVFESCYIAKQ